MRIGRAGNDDPVDRRVGKHGIGRDDVRPDPYRKTGPLLACDRIDEVLYSHRRQAGGIQRMHMPDTTRAEDSEIRH
nr:hypothetical protein [Rhizobium sullae]